MQPAITSVVEGVSKFVPMVVKKWYFNKLTERLAKTGLQYHDIVVENAVLQTTVSRLPEDKLVARQRRLKRALDLSFKHEEIPKDKQTNPWSDYEEFRNLLQETQMLTDEKAHLQGRFWTTVGARDKWFGYDAKKAWFLKK